MRLAATWALLFLCGTLGISAEQTIPAAEAAKHVGEKATVCGVVASASYASRTKGHPRSQRLKQPLNRN